MQPGTHLGPYEIVAPLGAGGMGEVYKARDTRLGRDVAIKVLPPEFAADPERLRRFEQEARAVAALDHPNILAIHDVGTHEGAPFIVTELLEGETLRDRLKAGGLTVSKAMEAAVQIAQGLAAAHEKGIIHRDLKPANVFIARDGRVKILDFGIAKLVAPTSAEELAKEATVVEATEAGTVLGTVGYMSPEQVRGEVVDARSDLFALGVLIYEMLTGRQAFHGRTPADTLSAILKEDPPDLEAIVRKTSPGLLLVLKRCLEKRKEDRFSSTQDVAFALQALAHPSSLGPEAESGEQSIVVLPFENLSPDPDNAYFADGLTEELIADLSKVKALRVISRTSAMQFKGKAKGIPEIARELKVGHALEGSVRRAGNSVRITAQLIEAATDRHLWAEKYTGTLDNIFELQEAISRRIVEALKGTLTQDDERRLATHATTDPRVYEVWLRARQEAYRLSQEGVEEAIRLTGHALETFGDHALLHAADGIFHSLAYDFGFSHNEETLIRVEASATRAIELNPELALAWFSKGVARYKRGDMLECVRFFRRAVGLERNSDTLFYLACTLSEVGRTDEARDFADEAFERDPFTWWTSYSRFMVDLFDGQFDAAVAGFQEWTAREARDLPFSLWWHGQALAYAGKEDEAIAVFERCARLNAGVFSDFCELGARAFRGERENARAWFESKGNLQQGAMSDESFPGYVSTCFARVGEFDLALRWLEQAIRWGFTNHRFHSEHNRYLAPLRGAPRFEALMKLAQEQARAIELG